MYNILVQCRISKNVINSYSKFFYNITSRNIKLGYCQWDYYNQYYIIKLSLQIKYYHTYQYISFKKLLIPQTTNIVIN